MLKYIVVFLSCLLFCQNVKAQKVVDSILYYMKDSGKLTSSRDSADYFLMIMSPDSTSNQMFRIEEYYPNNKLKLIGTSLTALYNNLVFNGPLLKYFPNGHRKTLSDYYKGSLTSSEMRFFPNGKLNYTIIHTGNYENNTKYVQCNDSTGKVLAANGKGTWITFDEEFKKIAEEGQVTDSLKDGEWHGFGEDSTSYTMTYIKGQEGAGIGYDKNGNAHPFKERYVQAFFKGNGKGKESYSDFLSRNLKVPKIDLENGTGGKVILQFVIEKDGTPSNFKVLRTPNQSLADESIRVIMLSKWNPAIEYGMPVRSYFTVPINFTIPVRPLGDN